MLFAISWPSTPLSNGSIYTSKATRTRKSPTRNWIDELNVDMDSASKQHRVEQYAADPSQPQHAITGQPWMVMLNGERVCHDFEKTIRLHCSGPPLLEYWDKAHKHTSSIITLTILIGRQSKKFSDVNLQHIVDTLPSFQLGSLRLTRTSMLGRCVKQRSALSVSVQ